LDQLLYIEYEFGGNRAGEGMAPANHARQGPVISKQSATDKAAVFCPFIDGMGIPSPYLLTHLDILYV